LRQVVVNCVIWDEPAKVWAKANGHAPAGGSVALRLGLDALAQYFRL